MADKNIKIQVIDKKAILTDTPVIVCGNSDYTATFTFDDEWDSTVSRTARFVYVKDGKVQHEDVVFLGNVVAVPILENVDFVDVGVFAGNLCTTTPARVRCKKSILCGSGAPHEPTPDVYNQIMVQLEEVGRLEQVPQIEQNRADIVDLQQSTENLRQATENLQKKADSYIQKESLAQTLDGGETDNAASVAAVNAALAKFSLTTRYVNDKNDENYGWVQLQLADGTWKNWARSDFDGRYLFFNGDEFTEETGGFVKYSGSGSIANNGSVLEIAGVQSTTSGETTYFGTNNEIDLSNIIAIEVVFSADLTRGSYNTFSLGVTGTRGASFTAVQTYTWNNNYTDETATIDVSNVDSGYFQIMEKSGYPTTASIKSIKLITA